MTILTAEAAGEDDVVRQRVRDLLAADRLPDDTPTRMWGRVAAAASRLLGRSTNSTSAIVLGGTFIRAATRYGTRNARIVKDQKKST
jgi:hypothetical protein